MSGFRSIAELAREMNIPTSTLHSWRESEPAFPKPVDQSQLRAKQKPFSRFTTLTKGKQVILFVRADVLAWFQAKQEGDTPYTPNVRRNA